ncbi:MAG: ATP-dependent acyl-CoA ligase [Actinomycetia bacterium]|nr:ATP-dependent acyl-CoA ligase [Actinomycetes bacterium]
MSSLPPQDLSTVLHQRAERFGSQPFLRLVGARSEPDQTLSWAETEELVARVGGGLMARGHEPGSGSVIMTAGGLASTQLVVWLACQRIGAVWAPLNPLLRAKPLTDIVAQAKPDLIVTDRAVAETPAVPKLDIDSLAAGHEVAQPATVGPLGQGLGAKLMFTSGTTGQPKGVVWNRRCEALWAQAYATELLDVDEGNGLFTCLPLAHVTAQGTVASALLTGATMTLADGFAPFSFWDQIRGAEARRFTFVGTILSTLIRAKPKPGSDRDHQLDRIVGAGAPPPYWAEIEDRFGVEIMETWGQTESAGCYTKPSSLPQRPGSIGRPTDRFEARLVPLNGSIGDGRGGELLIRPTSRGAIFDGYLRPDGSLESPYDADGWYHTGDLVRLGDDGDLEFVTRQRESIRRRGEIIASTPIEEAAATHPQVAEAAAIAVPAGDGVDEEIKLCITTFGPEPVSPVELHRFLRQHLPAFMVPRYIQHLTQLPKTPSTRVQKFKLDGGVEGAWDARNRPHRR